MEYRYTKDLDVRHIQPEDRVATYRAPRHGEWVVLVDHGRPSVLHRYCVVVFDHLGSCVNAMGIIDYDAAWAAFDKLRQKLVFEAEERRLRGIKYACSLRELEFMNQDAKSRGFDDAADMHYIMRQVKLDTREQLEAYRKWNSESGTRDGLARVIKLSQEVEVPA